MQRTVLLIAFVAGLASAQAWPSQSYRTERFNAPDLNISKSGQTAPGYLVFGPDGNGTSAPAPLIMTDDNDLVWHGKNISEMNVKNFRVQTHSRGKLLSYWTGFGGDETTYGHGLGSVHILDNTYNETHTICPQLPLYYENFTTHRCMLDFHESYITDHGSIVVTAFNLTKFDLSPVGGPRNGYIFDALFYDIDIATQKVLFRWSSLEHRHALPLAASNYPLTVEGTTYGSDATNPWDYFHINSVQPVKGGYLVSSRYYSTVFLVRHDGSVQWRLEGSNGGDFTLDPNIFFSYQHMPRLRSNDSGILTMTLFNNDNDGSTNGTNSTTGLELRVNTNTMHVSKLRELQDPEDEIFAIAQGSYTTLPGRHAFLGYGNVPQMKEFDEDGKVVMRVQYGNGAPAPLQVQGYRTFKSAWHATPFYPPKVVARGKKGKTRVFMSWNGATEYDGWNVYAGQKKRGLKKVATVARRGFETSKVLDKEYAFVQVEAREGKKAVRKSKVVKVR